MRFLRPITCSDPLRPIETPQPRAASLGLCLVLAFVASCASGVSGAADRDGSTAGTTTTITPAMTPMTAPTTTTGPTTTLSAAAVYVMEVCAILSEAGFETRRLVLAELPGEYADAGGLGDARDAVAAQCGLSLERFDAAIAVRDRVEAIVTDEPDAQGQEVPTLVFAEE